MPLKAKKPLSNIKVHKSMMHQISEYLISPKLNIHDVIKVINLGAAQIALVVDSEQRLLGTVTDGDIRRGLLNGKTLDSSVEQVMRREFFSLPADCQENLAFRIMRNKTLHHIPGLDSEGRIVRLFLLEDFIKSSVRSNWVVLMAGGKGTRMSSLTNNCPKPMLRVGGKPMLEIILDQCAESGFRKFFLSVHYLKKQITDYFGNGERWGVEIQYLDEEKPLGTAGSLGLLPEPEQPILVMNGDVLSRIDYTKLIQFHEDNKSSATICVREHQTEIPFGVVKTRGSKIESLEEKPMLTHRINAGIYVLNPEMIGLLSKGQVCDMPQLLEKGLKQNLNIHAFPLHEYWADVGEPQKYEQVNGEWQ
jgi:dTDP-glucose pyrophosphorylase